MSVTKEEVMETVPGGMPTTRWAKVVSVYVARGGEESRETIQRTRDRIPLVSLSALSAYELGVVMSVVYKAYSDGRKKGAGDALGSPHKRRSPMPGTGYNAQQNKSRLKPW